MNWLNIEVRTLRAVEYVGSDPVARATWLNVLAYCCEQENGGRLSGAKAWKDRQWQQTCGVMLSEVNDATTLLKWDGGDLVVWSYPIEKEAEIQSKRAAGSRGGLSKAKNLREAQPEAESEHCHELFPSTATSSASSTANGSASTERKGREEEGKRKGSTPIPPESAPASPSLREGKKDVLPTTPEAIAVANLFNRRLTTPWGPKEIKAYRGAVKRGVLTVEAIETIAAYYSAERAKGEEGRHRRDLQTFLNNIDGELDRAKARYGTNGNGHAAPKEPPAWGKLWVPWLREQGHDASKGFDDYQFAPDFLKSDFHRDLKSKPAA